jgi:membrane protein DedA with SNARE-associated domain
MSDQLIDHLRWFFATFGYWAVVLALLLENAGIPVPGETTLLFASFLAWSEHKLQLPYIILFGIVACTVGDNIGYWIGRRGGRPLLDRYRAFFHISLPAIQRGEKLFDRYGAATVFLARFVFGMRIVAGPMAGVLQMEWRRFLVFNLLGAIVWVNTISLLGYFFGRQWDWLVQLLGRANAFIGAIAAIVIIVAVRRYFGRHAETGEGEIPPQS